MYNGGGMVLAVTVYSDVTVVLTVFKRLTLR